MSDSTARLNACLEGRYRIEHEIGEGGMATVYLADDLRHERRVALKVLRPELAAVIGAERFLAEIKTTANLQHPHILPLFDSGEAGGFLYYVMPYVEGESLRARLDRERQLPVGEAVRIAVAVAHAAQHAHDHGVIHRDIKPANILLQDGEALVADFGIARALSTVGGPQLTETGISLGTPFYMSPEQAVAERELDGRSDEYSLACVTYEMLAGAPPFTGATVQAVLAQKMSVAPPDVSAIRSAVPKALAEVLRVALAPVPADRFPIINDFAAALSDPSLALPLVTPPTGVAALHGLGATAPLARWAPWGLTLVTVSFAIGTLMVREAPATRSIRTPIVLESPEGDPATSLDIAPNGEAIAFVAGPEAQLYVRRFDELTATVVPAVREALAPSFSADGASVAYLGPGLNEIRRVSLSGGPPVTVVNDAAHGRYRDVDWGDDGFLYFTHREGGVARVAAVGGEPELLTRPDLVVEGAQRVTQALPEGRGVLFVSNRWPGFRNEVMALDLHTRETRLLQVGVAAHYAPSGHLVTVRSDGTLFATPFDLGRLELTGAPVALAQTLPNRSVALSDDGTLLYWAAVGERGIVRVGRDGREDWLGPRTAGALHPAVSPDGERVAVSMPGPTSIDIWVHSLVDGTFRPLTFVEDDIYPAWSADGRYVYFARAATGNPSGDWTFYRVPSDGSGEPQPLLEKGGSQVEIAEAPDGRWVVYREGDLARGANARLLYVASDGSGEPHGLGRGDFDETSPAVSFDGRWLAYTSYQSGLTDVWLRSFPDGRTEHQVSVGSGSEPVWSRDRLTLYYRAGEYLMAADLEAVPDLTVQRRRRVLPTTRYDVNASHPAYGVLPGDSTFLFVAASERANLVLVLDWLDELKRLVPN